MEVVPLSIERVAYTPRETAIALGISRSRLYHLIHEGTIRTITVGARLRVPKAELERIAGEGARSAGAPAKG